jgi:hypothetical protein
LHSSLSIIAIGGTSAIFFKICVCVEKWKRAMAFDKRSSLLLRVSKTHRAQLSNDFFFTSVECVEWPER